MIKKLINWWRNKNRHHARMSEDGHYIELGDSSGIFCSDSLAGYYEASYFSLQDLMDELDYAFERKFRLDQLVCFHFAGRYCKELDLWMTPDEEKYVYKEFLDEA